MHMSKVQAIVAAIVSEVARAAGWVVMMVRPRRCPKYLQAQAETVISC